jgi:hypothetical protein
VFVLLLLLLLLLSPEPDGVSITWDNAQGTHKNLGDYYLAAMDAIDRQAGGNGPIYFIQVRQQQPLQP